MKFPSSALNAKNGEIYAHVFENQNIGLERNLFWSFAINFDPIEFDEETWDCSIRTEWLRLNITSWDDLNGITEDAIQNHHEMESSFYMHGHDEAQLKKLTVNKTKENIFEVSMELDVNFNWDDEQSFNMQVKGTVDMPFTGIIIVKDNLFPKPNSIQDVAEITSQYIDLKNFQEPVLEDWRWVLKPEKR